MKRISIDESYFHQVFEQVNAGVYTTDLKRRIMTWNSGAEKITGFSPDEVIGHTCKDDILVHRDKNGRPLCSTDLCPLHRAMQLNQASENPSYISSNTKTGKRIWVSVRVAPMRSAEKKVVGGIEVFEDVTTEVRDIEKVKAIQSSLLKFHLPDRLPVKIAHRYIPSETVGGDFYTFQEVDGNILFTSADFVGHGFSASFLGVIYKMALDGALRENTPQNEILTVVNRELTRYAGEPYLGTAILGVWDLEQEMLSLFNAGHPSPLRMDKSTGKTEVIDLPGLPLGEFFNAPEEKRLPLTIDQLLLLYSDGLTEIRDQQGNVLGLRPFRDYLSKNRSLDREIIFDGMLQLARDANNEVDFEDDITLICLESR